MSGPVSKYVTILDRELHYVEWGDASKPKLVLWHGLARTGRDFDDLAEALSSRWHIVAPDTIGRGLSQWSPKPEAEYCLAFYAQLATAFVDALGWDRFDWVGTSMGGAIAIHAGAGPLKGRIKRLVLHRAHPQLRRQATALRAIERTRGLSAADLHALWLSERRAMAAHGRDVCAPAARWRHYDAL